MTRKDKKNRSCKHCGYICTMLQKLREYLNRKNPYRPCISLVLLPQNPEPLLEPKQNSELLLKNLFQVVETHEFSIKNANDRLPDETIWKWGSRLRKRYKELSCQVLYDTLLQIDEEAYNNIEPTKQTKEEQKFFEEPKIELVKRQVEKNKQFENITLEADQTDKEFERLSMITGDNEKSIIFREQNIGPALKRRAVAVHNTKVPRYHPDNG
ncbi:7716_t:CDS:2, partial [Racocetra fulgida]